MTSLEDRSIWDDAEALDDIGQEIIRSSTDDIIARTRMLENEVRIMNSELKRLSHEQAHMHDKIKDNREKIKLNRQLPYLVGNVVELLDASIACCDDDVEGDEASNFINYDAENSLDIPKNDEEVESDEDEEEEDLDGKVEDVSNDLLGVGNLTNDPDASKESCSSVKSEQSLFTMDPSILNIKKKSKKNPKKSDLKGKGLVTSAQESKKSAVIKTSTRQTIFLPMVGLVNPSELKPGDLVGVNKDSYLILDKLPPEYDARVKAMEVDEKPVEDYGDIGGLDKQIEELVEAIVLPMTQQHRFDSLGIKSPKGVLMYGPPGTGKTLLARACAAQTKSTFLKLAGPQLVQMFIGDGAKLVRDAFALAREKQPTIIFIDEIDAVGTKRFDSEKSGDREVQRTMLELLNQLDGFSSSDKIKVIAATNRIDILDPALLRSGRLDRKIEFPHPNEAARARIIQIHSRKMTVSADVNYDELARSCDEFNGAQCKAICVEAGMIALRRSATTITHEDFMEGILEVQAKKKTVLQYYA